VGQGGRGGKRAWAAGGRLVEGVHDAAPAQVQQGWVRVGVCISSCGRAWAAGGRLVEYMKSRRPRSSSVRRLQSSTSGGRLAISGSRSKHTVADCGTRSAAQAPPQLSDMPERAVSVLAWHFICQTAQQVLKRLCSVARGTSTAAHTLPKRSVAPGLHPLLRCRTWSSACRAAGAEGHR